MNARSFVASEIQSAHFCPAPAFSLKPRAKRGRKADGLRYELKAQQHLERISEHYLPSPWIIFVANGRPHWCQPDGLHFDVQRGVLTVVEIKYAHTAEAHRQLRMVYAPVLARIFPPGLWTLRLVEMVKWFDPAAHFPEPTVMCPYPLDHDAELIGVHIWKP